MIKETSKKLVNEEGKFPFSNSAIEKWVPTYGDSKGKFKELPLDVPRDSHLKGLHIRHSRSSRKKDFILMFWFNKKPDRYNLGTFDTQKFNTKKVSDKLFRIVKEHTNDKGLWTKNPKITEKEVERTTVKEQIDEHKQKTVRETIEEFCKAGFPRGTRDGKLTARSISKVCRYLIGYNWRTKHLKFLDDDEGNGYVDFVPNYHKRTVRPLGWEDLFKKFPPGEGKHFIKKKSVNPFSSISLYDDDTYGKTLIEDFTRERIKKYLKKYKRYGSKKNLLASIKVLRHFAIDSGFSKDTGIDPTYRIHLKRPLHSKMLGSKYNETIFTVPELEIIRDQCLMLSERYPFQAEMLLMMMFTGRRFQELSKLKRTFVSEKERIIHIPKAISKIRRDEFITITDPVALVLQQLNKIHKRPGHEKFKFPPWLFNTVKCNPKRFEDTSYINSDYTRCKSVKECWSTLRNNTGIFGSPKTFRKTFSSLAKDTLKSTGKATKLTGHIKDQTLDEFYYKNHKEEVIANADQVALIFNVNPRMQKFN